MDTQQDVQDAYSDLYDALNDAYWAASTIEGKDLLHGLAEAVYDIDSQLNVADVKSRDDEFKQLTTSVGIVNAKLQTLQTEIDGIVHNISVATSVVNATVKVLSAAAEFMK